jgi:hypothetical protein
MLCMFLLSYALTIQLFWTNNKFTYHLVQDPFYFRHKNQRGGIGFWFLCSVMITYFTYYHNERYKLIYDKFKHFKQYDELSYKVIAFTAMILLIISPIIFGLIYNKVKFNAWV